jgi:hypothetical protein
VFVSHGGRDTWVAKQIARAVEEAGAETFLDEAEIEVGADFEQDIRASLERADELIVLWTPWSIERPFVWAEVGAAWIRQIPIVQVLYGLTATELQPRPGFPAFLKSRDMVGLNEIETYLRELGRRSGEAGRTAGG